jgi:uncharacterized glyoxalase superfamily protein PhnB
MAKSTKTPVKKKAAVKPIPDGMYTVTPHLVCAGAAAAIEFYKKAFKATEKGRLADDEGRIMHAQIKIGDSIVMLHDEFPAMGALGPKALKGTPVTLHLYVDDADAWFARAVKVGATAKMPVAEMFWGDRYGIVEDPFGHAWSLATHVRDLTAKQIREAAKEACA